MSVESVDDFPVWALLPKRETNVTGFLNKYLEFDGRGVVIAILDSGIDPGAKGLQVTSDGKRKIIEMMSASGAGDVDTSTVVTVEDGCIKGLSGRKLKIPEGWENPTGKYHVGIKSAYELYPKKLKERMVKERKEKFWDVSHKPLVADVCRKLQDFNNQHPNAAQLSLDQKLQKDELEAELDVLNNLEKKYSDVGPSYDCVVFHNGKQWKVVIDTSECGDLASGAVLSPYSESYEYATLTPADRLTYCVNVYDDGNLLEIVANSSSHGTHVASIAAGYFPDEPEKNGIAPGAQIVSIEIGDARLNAMETGSSLIRALIKVINKHCDVINMSYGEHSGWCGGRVLNMIHETVDKHGVIMVGSASNSGPALTTVGTPPVMPTCSMIGVGAYVSPDMMLAEYSMRDKVPGVGYTWTSRGPGINGDLVVNITAPGGAITSVPLWTLKSSQLMNGTSMSSPHAAGCVALLLSGLKAKNIPYSPYSIKRALENTAVKISTYDPFSMGHGLLQVDRAFDHLRQYADSMERDVRFHITTSDDKNGIYLREAHSTCRPKVMMITVEPSLLGDQFADPDRKLAFTMNLKLCCEAPWVSIPQHLNIAYASRSFSVKIDPCALPHGEHFTWIHAYDSSCIEKGPVFNIPVTVIISQKITDSVPYNVSRILQSGKPVREFIQVPPGATCATIRLKSHEAVTSPTIVIHAVQVRPQFNARTSEYHKYVRLDPKDEFNCAFPVKENFVLEVVFALWWAALEPCQVDYTIAFRGLIPDSSNLIMHGADGIHRIDIQSSLSYEEMLPSVSLKSHVIPVRPSENKISPLKSRDVIPEGRQIYEMQLTYSFNIAKAGEITPSLSVLSDLLYESEFESQLWMLFDNTKQYLGAGDAFPNRYSTKVEKGDYTLKLQIRHEDRSMLEKLSDAVVLVSLKMASATSFDVYDKHSQAIVSGKKATTSSLVPGSNVPIFLAPLPSDKLPKGCSAGSYMLGTVTLFKDEAIKKAGSFPIKYVIAELSKKSSSSKSTEKEKTLEEEFAEDLQQVKTNWIAKLTGDMSKDLYEETLAKEKDSQWPIMLARLQSLDKEVEKTSDSKKKKELLLKTVTLSDEITSIINKLEVLAGIGAKTDKKDVAGNKKLEQQKNCVIEALMLKGKALCDLYQLKHSPEKEEPETEKPEEVSQTDDKSITSETKSEDVDLVAIDEIYTELLKWADMLESKVYSFTEKHCITHNHYGRALKLLFKQLEDKKVLEMEQRCIDYFNTLGWNHCASHLQRCLHVRYPSSYRLF